MQLKHTETKKKAGKDSGKDSGKSDLKHRNTPSDDEIMSPSQYTTLFMFLAIK